MFKTIYKNIWLCHEILIFNHNDRAYIPASIDYLLPIKMDADRNLNYNYCLEIAMNFGRFEMVKWLTLNRPKLTGNYKLIDSAVMWNDFEMLKWLRENRTEKCSYLAIDHAAKGGNLEMVKWLWFNYKVGCSFMAAHAAKANGHLKVAKWITLNIPPEFIHYE